MFKFTTALTILFFAAVVSAQVDLPEAHDVKEVAKIVNLPGQVDAVAAAGAGRYILLTIGKLSKLAVFDVTQDKIVGYIPLASNESVVAGGLNKVIVVATDKSVIQRWGLEPIEKELTVPLPTATDVQRIAMGHASDGPVLLSTKQGPKFLSLQNLRILDLAFDHNNQGFMGDSLMVAASADGQTFAAWALHSSPSGVRWFQVRGKNLVSRYQHESAGELLPSWDGSLLLTANGILSDELRPIGRDQLRGQVNIPSYQAAYFVGVSTGNPVNRFPRQRNEPQVASPKLSVYTTGDRALLVTLDGLPELASAAADQSVRFGASSSLGWKDRIFLVPQHKKLVIVDERRDRLHIRDFDVLAALDKAGLDYLFVESLPPNTAAPGKAFRYAIQVRSKKGGVKMNLDSGPDGMTLKEGVLTWSVPPNHPVESVSVIVSIDDASKQSIFHTLNLQVGEAKRDEKPIPAGAEPGVRRPTPRTTPLGR